MYVIYDHKYRYAWWEACVALFGGNFMFLDMACICCNLFRYFIYSHIYSLPISSFLMSWHITFSVRCCEY